ncbi:hybrid sensor histidine kinase/response regulator [Aquabacterium parvum]|uniref:hybrid sensor histidine kinase/response regulator n=2 Tax=Aquabacterium TaxID=92793 RepID=UPI000718ADBB|nr:Hpt domain-containing protein [Aquabacterium parvum]
MDSLQTDAALPADDLSALAWVQDELRKSLDAAHKALNRALKDQASASQSDVDALDPSVLRTARQQIHQGVGALELAGLPAGAALLRASEALVQKFVGRPASLSADAVRDIERASFALLDYMGRRIGGKQVSAVELFPQYEALVSRVGGGLPRPSDLWSQDWPSLSLESRLEAPDDVEPRKPDAGTVDAFERGLLGLMKRQQPQDARDLAQVCAALARDAEQRRAHREAATWMLASGFLEGLADRHIALDVHAKRVLSSLLSQLRVLVRGNGVPSDRLANELLFFCAQAQETPAAERSVLTRVRRTFGLERHRPVSLAASSLGRHDPATIAQALKRVASAKEGWSAVAAGEALRLGGLNEQFSLVGDSLRKLFPDGEVLATALSDAVQRTVQSSQGPEAGLAMEVATSVLYVEACLEDGEFESSEQHERMQRLADRIRLVSEGQTAPPLEGWMEDLYRRVSDRQTIGSVVQELRTTLSECEKQIDQFFRDPQNRAPLVNVPNQLQSIRGVLAVLGLDLAAHASVRMRDDVDQLLLPSSDLQEAAESGVFDRLASNLGALGFLIDMMGVQPSLAKSLFTYDEASGVLSPLMGREKKVLSTPDDPVEAAAHHVQQVEKQEAQAVAEEVVQALEQAGQGDASLDLVSEQLQKLAETPHVQEQSELAGTLAAAQAALDQALQTDDAASTAAAREQVSQVLADLTQPEPEPEPEAPAFPPQAPLAPTPVVEALATGLEEDDEMREIFLEEAREVIDQAREGLQSLSEQPDDVQALTSVRRAFHTLKGSSRMVGLKEYGEAGWACEQLYNTWLASQAPASADLLGLSHEVLDHLAQWTEAIAERRDAAWSSAPVVAVADAMRLRGERHSLAAAPQVSASPDAALDVLPTTSESALVDLTEPLPLIEQGADLVSVEEVISLDLPELLAEPVPASEAALVAAVEAGLSDLDLPDALGQQPSPAEATSIAQAVVLQDEEPLDLSNLEVIEPVEIRSPDDGAPTQAGSLGDTAPVVTEVDFSLDLSLGDSPSGELEPAPEPESDTEGSDEPVKVIGDLRIPIPLFNIYLNEADEQSRRLGHALSEWALEGAVRPVGDDMVALAHSLAGNSATVGYTDLSRLARLLEHGLSRAQTLGRVRESDASLFNEAAEEIRQLLHQFAAGFLRPASPDLLSRLDDYDHEASRLIEARSLQPSNDDPQATGPGALYEASERSHLRLVRAEPDASEGPDEHEPIHAETVQPTPASAALTPLAELNLPWDGEDDIDQLDQVDADLFPIFEEEAQELLPQLANEVRHWLSRPEDTEAASACMRTLHTFKGGARLAGAMRLGELAHRLESAIERLLSAGSPSADAVAPLEGRVDRLVDDFEALRQRDATQQADVLAHSLASPLTEASPPMAPVPPSEPELASVDIDPDGPADVGAQLAEPASLSPSWSAPVVDADQPTLAAPNTAAEALVPIDWASLPLDRLTAMRPAVRENTQGPTHAAVRVRPQLLDRLVNHAGEVAITRTRLQGQVGQIKGSLSDLTENLDRLRQQLRDIELQAETQVATRMEQARAASQQFDPLEFDRYTRFQELTRMMAESVNDVATVQRTLQRSMETTEDQLAAQARLTRDLQDDLLRTRMVEFEGLSDRLYRVVRQAAKETAKQVRLDIVGGSTEVDRGVLERMTGAFEHLLRNCVTHGIESPESRAASGKDATGTITVTLSQEGNEVNIAFSDDGAGLRLDRIRERALSLGLIQPDAQLSDDELAHLIFTPGFSTADQVTELAGRGVGMDVVRAEVNAMGGRVETHTEAGQGTRFTLILPLTTAVTRVVMLRCGQMNVAVPTHLIEMVRRSRPAEVEQAYREGSIPFGDQTLPFYWLGALLDFSPMGVEGGRSLPVVIVRSAQQRIAIHVDEVLGNQEVVVKNLGTQLSRLPGLAGMTLLASGAVSLIYNPVALATVYGDQAREVTGKALAAAGDAAGGWLQPHAKPLLVAEAQSAEPDVPLVLVVDDSLTVRRVTQRLLAREGYRVNLAKDGLEALESLAQERPAVVLSDIEMPRMDGFDLVRNIRADQKLAGLPVIMITSRIAQKHRDYAAELGVNHYLGKPYREEELLALVARHAAATDIAIS